MVLINGAEGIGTGWSTSIPNYSPRNIVSNIRYDCMLSLGVALCARKYTQRVLCTHAKDLPWRTGFTTVP